MATEKERKLKEIREEQIREHIRLLNILLHAECGGNIDAFIRKIATISVIDNNKILDLTFGKEMFRKRAKELGEIVFTERTM